MAADPDTKTQGRMQSQQSLTMLGFEETKKPHGQKPWGKEKPRTVAGFRVQVAGLAPCLPLLDQGEVNAQGFERLNNVDLSACHFFGQAILAHVEFIQCDQVVHVAQHRGFVA